MYRNPIWIVFLSALSIGIMIYTAQTAYYLWHYIRLDKQARAEHIQWSILSSNEETYIPYATYQFTVEGKKFQGETSWKEAYLNEWTAKEAIGRLKDSWPPVSYNSSDPGISSLQNLFPLKESFYTLLLWILALYFLGLGYYVKRRS